MKSKLSRISGMTQMKLTITKKWEGVLVVRLTWKTGNLDQRGWRGAKRTYWRSLLLQFHFPFGLWIPREKWGHAFTQTQNSWLDSLLGLDRLTQRFPLHDSLYRLHNQNKKYIVVVVHHPRVTQRCWKGEHNIRHPFPWHEAWESDWKDRSGTAWLLLWLRKKRHSTLVTASPSWSPGWECNRMHLSLSFNDCLVWLSLTGGFETASFSSERETPSILLHQVLKQ